MRNAYMILVEKLKEVGRLGDLGEDGMVILEWILKKQDRKMETRCLWFRAGTSGRLPKAVP
jgi:hypothetical protein